MKRKILSLVLVLILVGSCLSILTACDEWHRVGSSRGSFINPADGACYDYNFEIYHNEKGDKVQIRNFTLGTNKRLSPWGTTSLRQSGADKATFKKSNGCWQASIQLVDSQQTMINSNMQTNISSSINGTLYIYGTKDKLPSGGSNKVGLCLGGRVSNDLQNGYIEVAIDWNRP